MCPLWPLVARATELDAALAGLPLAVGGLAALGTAVGGTRFFFGVLAPA